MKQALIIFTKEPVKGKVKTRLANAIGKDEALSIYELLLNQILDIQTHADKLIFVDAYTPSFQDNFLNFECYEQEGSDIGQKMANAFEKAFEQGYESVVLVGADIPLLDNEIIQEAFFSLQSNHAVLNQSKDGGYYLIGFGKSSYTKEAFKIDFSKDVFTQTLQALKPLHVKVGKELFDIDYLHDLRRYDALCLHTPLALHVKKLLASYPKISVIIPVYHEKDALPKTLAHLRQSAKRDDYEIIIADTPKVTTLDKIETKGLRTCTSKEAGRAFQLNAGANIAKGEILLFLHADTLTPKHWDKEIENLHVKSKKLAGAFSLGILTDKKIIKLIEYLANFRVMLTNTPYGDQGQFFDASLFFSIGCYDEIPLMEDINVVKKLHLRKISMKILKKKIFTSDRRWKKEGIAYSIVRNRTLSTLYFLGVSPKVLKRFYLFNI